MDNNELDYFKQAESTLNINAFETDEERQGFINSVLDEAQGKELKLVTNQICSKLMERLILFANHNQLKKIFKQFQNHFVSLAFHKYASHVLETLLVRSAALIEKELTQTDEEKLEKAEEEEAEENSLNNDVPMEDLFISMLNEFKPHLTTMIDHLYASHVLRLLILILAGKRIAIISNIKFNFKIEKIQNCQKND